jgi:hypothetical protein
LSPPSASASGSTRRASPPDWSPPPGTSCRSPPRTAALMARVFELDVLLCPRCGGPRRIVAVYHGGPPLRALLQRLGLGAPPTTGGP